MNKCTKCNTELKLMFSSYYCPNDCDRISVAQPSAYTGKVYWDRTVLTFVQLEDLEYLQYKYPDLITLSLSATPDVTDASLAHLINLTGLLNLALHDLRIGDAGLVHVSKLSNLTTLVLYGTQVGDAGLAHLTTLTNLNTLSVGHTQVSDVGLSPLSSLTNLKYLYLRWTRVTKAGIAKLQKSLPNCSIIL